MNTVLLCAYKKKSLKVAKNGDPQSNHIIMVLPCIPGAILITMVLLISNQGKYYNIFKNIHWPTSFCISLFATLQCIICKYASIHTVSKLE